MGWLELGSPGRVAVGEFDAFPRPVNVNALPVRNPVVFCFRLPVVDAPLAGKGLTER